MDSTQQKPMTFGMIVGNRGFFPDHLAKSGREEMIAAIEGAGHKVVALTPEESKYGAVESRAGSPALRRSVQAQSRIPRRHHRHPAQFRRRARHRRHPARRRPARARARAGHARHAGPHDHPRPPRQLLRQDVRLQQPAPVRHSVFPDRAPHRSARLRFLQAGPGVVRRASAAWSKGCAACASAPSARVPAPSTPSATARNCWSRRASRWSPSTSPKSSAASSA